MGGELRHLFLATCKQLADALSAHGFTSKRAGQSLVRVCDDLRCEISISSSHLNRPDYVPLWIAASVHSKLLKSWRQRHERSLTASGQVFGCSLGFLFGADASAEWNVAHEHNRAAVLADALAKIKLHALPHFEQFKRLEALPSYLVRLQVPGPANLSGPFQYFLAVGRPDLAKAFLHQMMRARDVSVSDIRTSTAHEDLVALLEQYRRFTREEAIP